MLSEKEEKYIELVKDMRECRICQGIKAPAYWEDGEYLVNDSHGIVSGQEPDIDRIYVNRWNMWQGSLDAEIMVIGLDFGRVTEGSLDQPEGHRWWEEGILDWKSPTDKNLNRIFSEAFGGEFDLTKPCDKLFFTNIACCYRQKKTSGASNGAWYAFCARRYLGRLIQIIDPRLIVCLGLQVFESLGYCEGGRILCTDDRTVGGDDLPYRTAQHNMKEYMPELLVPMQQLLQDTMGLNMEESALPLYVLTNSEKMFGASAILYSEKIKELADELCSDLLILPSSVHEVLLFPDDRVYNYETYRQMVKEVNNTSVDPEEVLSFHLYRYSRAKNEIEEVTE